MTRTEDRLADALGAAARTMREDMLRSPVAPAHRERHWARWLAPAAAAVAVTLVVVLVAALARHAPAPAPIAPSAAGVPRYYVDLDFQGKAVVRSTVTGKVTATVPVHAVANGGDGALAAAGDGTFFVGVFTSQSQERIYRFEVTATGQVSGFAPVPGGVLSSQAQAMAATPDGSRLAVATAVNLAGINSIPSAGTSAAGTAKLPASGATGGTRQLTSAQVTVIDVQTGARSVWRGGLVRQGYSSFSIESLSWTSDQKQLVFAGQWCWPQDVNNQVCMSAVHGNRRLVEVRSLNPAAGGGQLSSGRLLLRQSARFPYIASAVISPDGQTITAVILHGRSSRSSGGLPGQLSVVRIPVGSGQQRDVLYQRPTDPTFGWHLSPDGTGRHWLLTGVNAYESDGPKDLSKRGYNGWISNGRLIPLQPAQGYIAGEAW
jgi:hypothetical protein